MTSAAGTPTLLHFFYSTGWYPVIKLGTDGYPIFEKAQVSGIFWYGIGCNGT